MFREDSARFQIFAQLLEIWICQLWVLSKLSAYPGTDHFSNKIYKESLSAFCSQQFCMVFTNKSTKWQESGVIIMLCVYVIHSVFIVVGVGREFVILVSRWKIPVSFNIEWPLDFLFVLLHAILRDVTTFVYYCGVVISWS